MLPNTDTPAGTPPRPRKVDLWTVAMLILAGVLAVYAIAHLGQQARKAAQHRQQLQEAAQIDERLQQYQEVRSVATGFQAPRAIAVTPTGRLYVAGDRGLHLFSPEGKKISAITLPGEPRCLAVSKDLLYIGMADHIEVYRQGTRTATWSSLGKDAVLTALAVSGNAVYAADAGQRVVWKMSLTGKVLGSLGQKDAAHGVPGLVVPSPHLDVAVRDDLILVANPGRHQVESYHADGQLTDSWGEAGSGIAQFSGCCNPTDFAVLPSGHIVTSEKGLPRVKVFTADGALESVVATEKFFTSVNGGLDLAVDGAGTIYVLDPEQQTVRIFTRKTEVTP